jgi:BlaR1 peptidase M56
MILLDASVRILVVAALAALVLGVLRVRSSALRHRVWALVAVAMLLMPVLPAIVPAIGVPLPARGTAILPDAIALPGARFGPLPASRISLDPGARDARQPVTVTYVPPEPARVIPVPNGRWIPPLVLAMYLAGAALFSLRLAGGYRSVRRLIRASSRVDLRQGVAVYESAAIAAPLTAGILAPLILLPSSWTSWPDETLRACLAHEIAHVRRRDPLVAFVAHLNRCVFWFHPLAWWLERTLAATAEHAADDEAVRELGHRRRYAEVLLDMADAVRARGGRVAWQGIGVDGSGLLGRRIDRILRGAIGDDMSRPRKTAVFVACVAAIVIVVACRRDAAAPPLQPNAEAAAQFEEYKRREALVEEVKKLKPSEIDALEGSLKRRPDDLEALDKLKVFYLMSGHTVFGWNELIERRRPHILWVIDNRPDHGLAMWRVSPTADPITYAEGKERWLAQAAKPDASDKALTNAAFFLEQGDPELAVQVLMRLKDPVSRAHRLGLLYGEVVQGPTSPRDGSPLTPFDSDPYARNVRRTLEESRDPVLLAAVGQWLATKYGDEARRDLGRRLLERAVQIDPQQQAAARMLAGIEDRDRTLGLNAKIQARAAEIAGVAGRKPPLSRDDRAKVREAEPQAVAELSERERYAVLPELADLTYMGAESLEWNKDTAPAAASYARSKTYAQEALVLATRFRDDPYHGTAIYRAHVALAVHALRDDDTAGAVRHMRDAVKAPPSRGLDPHLFGLDTRLMNYLLDRGERDSVAEFLERSADLRSADRERLLKDAAAIRAGQMPLSYQAMRSRGDTYRVPGVR